MEAFYITCRLPLAQTFRIEAGRLGTLCIRGNAISVFLIDHIILSLPWPFLSLALFDYLIPPRYNTKKYLYTTE